MKVTKETMETLLEAANPLIKFLNENCHPHCNAVVTQNGVTLNEEITYIPTYEFVKD